MFSSGKTSKKKKRPRSKRAGKGRWKSIAYAVYAFVVLSSVLIGMAAGAVYLYIINGLPKISSLKDYNPPVLSTIYSCDHQKIGEFYKEKRIVVSTENIPKLLSQAFIAAEDARFYEHKGVDFFGVLRAFFKNIEAGTIVQGGSTITQQVTKSLLLTPERRYIRKVKEAVLAYRIEKSLSKDEILHIYLNQIYLGSGAYGVEAAAQTYFGKSVSGLSLAECALLAGLPQAPSRYSPVNNLELAKERQHYTLNRMVEVGYITQAEALEAADAPIRIQDRPDWHLNQAHYYTEYVRQYIEAKYGKSALYEDGLEVRTAVNIGMQKAAEEALKNGLAALDKRQGYRGPIKRLRPEDYGQYLRQAQEMISKNPVEIGMVVDAIVAGVNNETKTVKIRIGNEKGDIPFDQMKWAKRSNQENTLRQGDVILVKILGQLEDKTTWLTSLEQKPEVEGALLCMEVATGMVRSMIGGLDFQKSQFNRAIQSRRQPGSAFKPIIYAAALDKGYTPASVILDAPIVFGNGYDESLWKPRNYEEKFHGPTLFRTALAQSRNIVTIKILQDIGLDYVIDYAKRLGIESPMGRNLSLALGSSGVSLLELVRTYSVFADNGYMMTPIFVTSVIDKHGKVLEANAPKGKSVISRQTAFIVTSLLQAVVKEGTGRRALALNRPVAGKTGTTNNLHDAWFIGYTPDYVTGAWVGFDTEKPLGKEETGARAAIPVWLAFMQEILKDKEAKGFPTPEGIVFAKIDAETGRLAGAESTRAIFECFKDGTAPTEYARTKGVIVEEDQFFKADM
ncbi:MAG: PBP1A family penicillin-binding protein [Pseudomonadota bacterium]